LIASFHAAIFADYSFLSFIYFELTIEYTLSLLNRYAIAVLPSHTVRLRRSFEIIAGL
jgi:hypothetical protein